MELSLQTKIGTLVDKYPFLLDFLAEKSPKFEKLKNPILRKTIGKAASISQAASIGGLVAEVLLMDIATQIYLKSNDSIELVNAGGKEELAANMSSDERIAAFKDIVIRVHNGESLDSVRDEFHELLRDVSPAEIGAMEQALVADGIDESEIKKMCNLHVELFESSVESNIPDLPAGHPLHTMRRENEEAEARIDSLSQTLESVKDQLTFDFSRNGLMTEVDDLYAILRHYERKENQLFPIMESIELTAPPQVMWAIHDDIRDLFKRTRIALDAKDYESSVALINELSVAIKDMIYKEEKILFPMCYESFTEEDWAKVRRGEEEIGFAWVTPGDEWTPVSLNSEGCGSNSLVNLSAGKLRPEVVDAIFKSLPIDLSFVDANDKVAYFSQTEHRIFPRSEAIIGREVSKCHPAKSVYMVEEILEKFKSGERDIAEFWIEMNGSFIHIRFYAIRLDDGTYEGCLEVAQDVTSIRALTGQQRLLDWK